jgi:hypothetical protein
VHGAHPEHLEAGFIPPDPAALDPVLSNAYVRNLRAPWYMFILKARADDCYTWVRRNQWKPQEYPNPFCPHCLAAGVEVLPCRYRFDRDGVHWNGLARVEPQGPAATPQAP